jgi:capsular exopolysaccharide synthesis family protein
MSEIFDFLKKTEADRKKNLAVDELSFRLPEDTPAPVVERLKESVVQDPIPYEAEICNGRNFDLTEASLQIKSVLDPLTLVGEQFRLLRSKLGLMQKQRGIKTVLVTSAVPEEGKTFVASGLTGVFAQEPGKRVVLIDADMRKPKSGAAFGLNGSSNSIGLSTVLQGNIPFQNALLASSNPEFCFLASGTLPPNPSELLSSAMLEQVLKSAAEDFDWVIVDSPPVLALSDATPISSSCDAIIFVVRANSTPAKLVQEAVNRIGRDKICGVVINRQRQSHASKYYYQYYYRSSK